MCHAVLWLTSHYTVRTSELVVQSDETLAVGIETVDGRIHTIATATIPHPVMQGLLQSLGVFTDTLVICTCTAFIILLSGLYTSGEDGILLTSHAMEHHLGSFGGWFLLAAIFLFAYSTIIANYFYGETNIRYITGKSWAVIVFRLISGVVVLMGGFLELQQAWSIVDLAMALMTVLNLIAVCMLSRTPSVC